MVPEVRQDHQEEEVLLQDMNIAERVFEAL
jgi:hypothetical protein